MTVISGGLWEQAKDQDAGLPADLDLSIPGREAEVFWRYEGDIRKEYAWVQEDLFRRERVRILWGFLDRPQIYYHAEYSERFEARARANLKLAPGAWYEK